MAALQSRASQIRDGRPGKAVTIIIIGERGGAGWPPRPGSNAPGGLLGPYHYPRTSWVHLSPLT